MLSDLTGTEVALTSPDALARWNATITGFLAHSPATPVALSEVLSATPDFATGHAVRGLFCVLLGRREMIEVGRDAAALARAGLARGNQDRRSRHMLAALDAMLARTPHRAIAEIEESLMGNPGDTLAMKLSHGIRFLLGDAKGMRRSVERVLAAHGPDHPLRGYTLGCHAFALEETGDYDAAERTGMQGLDYAKDDAWGLHAVAHVMDMTARADAGIALIDGHHAAWAGSNNFRYHVWWHKALLHLERGEIDTVFHLYDQQIRVDQTDDYRDIANATSLLQRLELEGVAVGSRWDELAALADARVEDGCLVFADLHYMLALIGGDHAQAQTALKSRLAQQANATDGLASICNHPGRAAAEGLEAFGEGSYDRAFAALEAARPQLQSIGGSHAQRDVFDRMTIDAGLRAGQIDRAETILRDRILRRGGHMDRFSETRLEQVASARALTRSVPAV